MQQLKYLFFLMLQLGIATASASPVSDKKVDWLEAMAYAAHQINYSGVFVYQSGGNIEVSRVTHVTDKDGEHERLEGLVGVKREIIRDNDQVWLYSDGHKVRIEKRLIKKAFPALLPEQISTLKENYAVVQAEDDEIAGYHAHSIVLLPRDNLRYARKMWADSGSGLLLKAVVMDDRGFHIEQYAFMQLSVGNNIERKWIVPETSSVSKLAKEPNISPPLSQVEFLDGPSGWQVDALPPGFRKILEMRRPFRGNKEPVIHMVFSDGLAGISVFIEQAEAATYIHSGLSGQGAAHVYNRIVGENLVTVVGEVPPLTVIQVGDSVRYAGQ